MLRDFSNKKTDYSLYELVEKNVDKDPIKQFISWLDQAIQANMDEPNAMILSTVNEQLRPSSRVVLLKGVLNEGFLFYTNYLSKKGKELANNPYASLVFFWAQMERQVRIEGKVEKLPENVSDEYFFKRPIDSQLGAIASPQSDVISSREFLIKKIETLKLQTLNKQLARPDYWGGYILKPNLFEFWQGRANRLNDRIQYIWFKEKWKIRRLAP